MRCLACVRRCLLRDGAVGYCTAVINHGGTLYNTAFGVIAEASVNTMESKPVFHYNPGARTLSLGGLGCNLRCSFCQNWEIAFRDARDAAGLTEPNLTPDAAVALALDQNCQALAWSHNEPSITPAYTLESARAARAAGLFTVYVTNGLITHEALTLLGPWLDVYRVDVKSLDTGFYRQVGGLDRISEVLPLARRAQHEFGIHVETVTNIMETMNDSDEHLARLAGRIVETLGADTPWHLTTYVPYAFMTHIPPTKPETLARTKTIGQREGLRFVYTDSLTDPNSANTRCPRCGALAIERTQSRVVIGALTPTGACAACGEPLGIRMAPATEHTYASI